MSVLVQEEKEKDVASLMENRIISFFLDSCQTVNASIGKVYKAFYEPMQTRHDFAKNWNCWLLVLAWSSVQSLCLNWGIVKCWTYVLTYLPSGVLFVSRSVVDSAKTSSFCRIMRNIATLMPRHCGWLARLGRMDRDQTFCSLRVSI